MRGRRAIYLLFPALTLIAILVSCGGSEKEAVVCVEDGVDPTCEPAYEPTYDQLYAQTFSKSCTLSGVACHASTGKQGGVSFGEIDSSYDALVGKVRPGDPACSMLVRRVLSTNSQFRMPPGRALSTGETCAIIRWIADGAKR